jgi:hypothetical protein
MMFMRVVHRQLSSRIRRYATESALSAVDGPLHPPLATHTLPSYFTDVVLKENASRTALVCCNEARDVHGGPESRNVAGKPYLVWDFEEFDRHINALARGLLGLGVRKGDRVGVIMGNNRYGFGL